MSPEVRVERLSRALAAVGFDAYLIMQPANLFYFTGVPVRVGAFLVRPDGPPRLLVREQNLVSVAGHVPGCEVVPLPGGGRWEGAVAAAVGPRLQGRSACDEVPVTLAGKLSAADSTLVPRPDIPAALRRKKDAGEAACLRRAIAAADAAARAGIAALRPGIAEVAVVAEMEAALRRAGAQGTRFSTRFGSGAGSADCDAEPTDKLLVSGDLGFFDVGPVFDGYLGDLSRGFVVGSPTSEHERLAGVALEVLARVTDLLRPGARVTDLCAAAQRVYDRAGLDGACRHHLGHGLGLAMDPPLIREGSTDQIEEGDYLAIEPGVYVPGVGGVRFENTYLVGREGPELLTACPLRLGMELA